MKKVLAIMTLMLVFGCSTQQNSNTQTTTTAATTTTKENTLEQTTQQNLKDITATTKNTNSILGAEDSKTPKEINNSGRNQLGKNDAQENQTVRQ